ncbi:MAG: hypothetical protein KAS96_03625 [Planctomycetes bacterium]|nr:hypothetical protein [Planctomycetota bacterium]
MKIRFFQFCVLVSVLVLIQNISLAVNSQITRQSSSVDLLKGTTENVVISSQGTITLGRVREQIAEEFEDVWSINCIALSGSTVFVGTSPNGGIYKYSLGKLTKIYPEDKAKQEEALQDKPGDVNDPNDPNEVKQEQYLLNEHIFAMTTDISGRLIAGISGENCRLIRLETDSIQTIFEPVDANYIFAVTVADNSDIYVGTGPEGKIYSIDSVSNKEKMIYDSIDKNILSLAAGADGYVYAGSDGRGLVYKIAPASGKATVLYDCDQSEVTSLVFDDEGNLYATATSAKMVSEQRQFASKKAASGKPESKTATDKRTADNVNTLKLEIANTKAQLSGSSSGKSSAPGKPGKPAKTSHVYKINKDGFVTSVFDEAAVFFCLAKQGQELILGTGNDGKLYTIDAQQEEEKIVYEDENASQITAIYVFGDDIYIGTANPAKLLKLGKGFAKEGSYSSDLIDAGQPSMWGKLQIEADIPQGCEIELSARSGNVKDINDPTFSEWTECVKVTEPIQLTCPLGRFCQYKLTLKSSKGDKSPVVREIAVANTVPNLAPKVVSIEAVRDSTSGKEGFFNVGYKATDSNGDKLIYKIDFRKVGWQIWIEIKDKYESDSYLWDSKTVEDGRYEIKITASDERSNTTTTKLSASRVSDVIVVDNTAPVVQGTLAGQRIFKAKVTDKLSVIGKLEYAIDSSDEWISLVPEDGVYDTMVEEFKILIEDDVKSGEHVISLKAVDAVGNTKYRNFKFQI